MKAINQVGVCSYEVGTGWLCTPEQEMTTSNIKDAAPKIPCFDVKGQEFFTSDLGELCPFTGDYIVEYRKFNCFLTSNNEQLRTYQNINFCSDENYSAEYRFSNS